MTGRLLLLAVALATVLSFPKNVAQKPKSERESPAILSSLPFEGPVVGVVTDDGGDTLVLTSGGGVDGGGRVQGWLLCTDGSSNPSWRKIATSDERPRADDGGLGHPLQVTLLPNCGLMTVADANGRLLILPTMKEPVALVRDSAGQPVWRRIDVEKSPVTKSASPWFVGPLVVTFPPIETK